MRSYARVYQILNTAFFAMWLNSTPHCPVPIEVACVNVKSALTVATCSYNRGCGKNVATPKRRLNGVEDRRNSLFTEMVSGSGLMPCKVSNYLECAIGGSGRFEPTKYVFLL